MQANDTLLHPTAALTGSLPIELSATEQLIKLLLTQLKGGPLREDQAQHLLQLRQLSLSNVLERQIAHPDENLKPREVRRAKHLIREFPAFVKQPIYAINTADIFAFIDARKEKDDCGNATINRDLSCISSAYSFAKRYLRALDLTSPMIEEHRLPEEQFEITRLEPTVEALMLKNAMEYELTTTVPLATIMKLLILTAMRRSELANLDWRDVNLKGHSLLIRTSKNGRPRTVPLWPEAVELFNLLGPKSFGRIFPCADTISTAWYRVRARAQAEARAAGDTLLEELVTRLRLHDLRHEGITRLIERTNWPDVKIMAIVGHRHPKMLERYTHLRTQNIAREMHLIEIGTDLPGASDEHLPSPDEPSPSSKAKAAWDTIRGSQDLLKSLIWQMPLEKIGAQFGISDNAVRKAALKLGISMPGRGYWLREENSVAA